MKKHIELTKAEIKAVKLSVAHWKRDIQSPLMKGRKIVDGCWDNGREVKDVAQYCAMCILVCYFQGGSFACSACPYYKKYGYSCTDGHWRSWHKKSTLPKCNAMIKALEGILE